MENGTAVSSGLEAKKPSFCARNHPVPQQQLPPAKHLPICICARAKLVLQQWGPCQLNAGHLALLSLARYPSLLAFKEGSPPIALTWTLLSRAVFVRCRPTSLSCNRAGWCIQWTHLSNLPPSSRYGL